MAKAIRDLDRGYGRILKALVEFKGQEIAVGLQAGDKTKDGKMDVADVGAVQEFGSPKKNIPERSFMRSTCDEKQKNWYNRALNQVGEVIDSKKDMQTALERIGTVMQKDIQKKIVTGPFAPNAPYTVFKKLSKSRHGILRAAASYIGDGSSKGMGGRMSKITGLEGSTRPLIDTGHMRQSIRYVVRKRGSGRK